MVAIFFCSTGRCATQALTSYFSENLGESAVTEHEPLGARMNPRRALRHGDLATLRRSLPEIDRHFDRISQILAGGRHYVDAGWPAYAWFPYLKELLGDQFRWVHIVRNPLHVASSFVTLRPDPHFAAFAHLQPTDPGAAYPEFAREWAEFSRFEKYLYYWLEINRYACDLTQLPGLVPVRTIRYEDLFGSSPEPMRRLYSDLELGTPTVDRPRPVDRYRSHSREQPSLRSRRLSQEVEAMAARFGYMPAELDLVQMPELWRRYSSPWREAKGTGLKIAWRLLSSYVSRVAAPRR